MQYFFRFSLRKSLVNSIIFLSSKGILSIFLFWLCIAEMPLHSGKLGTLVNKICSQIQYIDIFLIFYHSCPWYEPNISLACHNYHCTSNCKDHSDKPEPHNYSLFFPSYCLKMMMKWCNSKYFLSIS